MDAIDQQTDVDLWKDDRVATALNVSSRTLFNLTAPRGPLPCVRIGGSVRYDPRDVRAYVEASKVGAVISA